MLKIAHECPLSISKEVEEATSYNYYIATICKANSQYLEHAISSTRYKILDTGVFEEGKPLDRLDYIDLIKQICPDEYIIPDYFGDFEGTKKSFQNWLSFINDFEGKGIAVVQGSNIQEQIECYKLMTKEDSLKIKIAFPFATPIDIEFLKSPEGLEILNYLTTDLTYPDNYFDENEITDFKLEVHELFKQIKGESLSRQGLKDLNLRFLGRMVLICKLIKDRLWNFNFSYHLLGIETTLELLMYRYLTLINWGHTKYSKPGLLEDFKNEINFIEILKKREKQKKLVTLLMDAPIISILSLFESIDTSSPVLHGIKGISYNKKGILKKDEQMMKHFITEEVNSEILEKILNNIKIFNSICNQSI